MSFQIAALKGQAGPGVDRAVVGKCYRDFKLHVLGTKGAGDTVWHDATIEVRLDVAADLLQELALGRAEHKKKDRHGAYVERSVPFGADTYTIRIREPKGMKDPIVCVLPAYLNGGRELHWTPQINGSSTKPQAMPVAQKPAQPAAQARPTPPPQPVKQTPATTVKGNWPDGWGPPGEGGVNLKLLIEEYERLRRTVYRGTVPQGSVTAVVWWGIAERLYKELESKLQPDPKGRTHVISAETELGGDKVIVCLSYKKLPEKLPDGKKRERVRGFQINNIPGREDNGPQWWWPEFKLEELMTDPRVARVTAVASGLKSRLKLRKVGRQQD